MFKDARTEIDGMEAQGVGEALKASAMNDTYEAPDHTLLRDHKSSWGSHERGNYERDLTLLVQTPTGWYIVLDSDAGGWIVAFYDDKNDAIGDYEEFVEEQNEHV